MNNSEIKKIVNNNVTKHIINERKETLDTLLNSTFALLNEGYVFNEDEDSEVDPEVIDTNNNTPELNSVIRKAISDIRKKVLYLMSSDDIDIHQDTYKSLKSLWDICDKMLINKQK